MAGAVQPPTGGAGTMAGVGGSGGGGAGKDGKADKGDKGGMPGTSGTGGTDTGATAGVGADCIPSEELCNGVDDDCNDEVDEGGVCPNGCAAQTYGSHLYLLCLFPDGPKPTYADATAACKGFGSELGLGISFELAWIESERENTFVKNWIKANAPAPGGPSGFGSTNPVWMGANDISEEGVWVWGEGPNAAQFYQADSARSGGSDVNGGYDDFGTGRPNINTSATEDCGAFDAAASWDWNDVSCMDPALGYVCEENP